MEAPKYPDPPDPTVTAAAQTASNKDTAVANAYLNRVDQTSPYGSTKWTTNGTNPDGTPIFKQETSLSQPVQGLFDSYMNMTKGMGDIGNSQLQGLQDQYAKPFDLNTEAENKIVELQKARLDPQMQQQDAALRTRLTNQGIQEGTDAWDRALTRQGQISNDAYNQMYINARQQGVNEATLQRQLPLNEFNAMRTGTQVQSPTFAPIANVSQANTDVAGITQANFANQMGIANAQNAQNNAFMSGLFGMGGAAASMLPFSDIRLKKNIVRIGALPSGLPVYEFDYIWDGPRQVGVMAQEAQAMFPEAVHERDGFLAVDYGRIA